LPRRAGQDRLFRAERFPRRTWPRRTEAWRDLAARAPIPVYYRRREQNIARKPGNIAEWVRRFGAAYETMLVLDADSLMSGEALSGWPRSWSSAPRSACCRPCR
jgi:membrane glycosyltransferase